MPSQGHVAEDSRFRHFFFFCYHSLFMYNENNLRWMLSYFAFYPGYFRLLLFCNYITKA